MTERLENRARSFAGGLLLAFPLSSWAVPDLDGVWMVQSGSSSGLGEIAYTDEGRERQEAYDFLTDDHSLWCIPASLGRIWGNPGSPIEFRLSEDRVVISYELFDLVRTIELDQRGHPVEAAPSVVNADGDAFATMGHSIGWYADDVLVVETIAYAPGYVTTSSGVPQSRAMRTIERFSRAGDQLAMEITYIDPIVFQAPLTATYRFNRSLYEVGEYGCTPENASYGQEQN